MQDSEYVRKRLQQLGRLSRPLGEHRAKKLAVEIITLIAQGLVARREIDRVIEIYETRIEAEVANVTGQPDKSFKRQSSDGRLRRSLPEFSESDVFEGGKRKQAFMYS